MANVIDLFLEYVKLDTRSEETNSSKGLERQRKLAELLVRQLKEMGVEDIIYDRERCYVYAGIPAAAGCENKPVLGFIAHMDTSPAMSGERVTPRIVENYDGGDIVLNKEQNVLLSPKDFPELRCYTGDDLIVTDGTTLLGADDKAGIAEIMAMAEMLCSSGMPHGNIRIAFTSDEEIGQGADGFNVAAFGADFAYTVDGGRIGELEYENFNAADAKVCVQGCSVHPGDGKNKMKNACLLLQEFQSLLPAGENPMYTAGYEGFYHLDRMQGNVEKAVGEYIIRDHNRQKFEARKALFRDTAEFLNKKYGQNTVTIDMADSYYNMREVMEKHMHLIENAKAAMEELGIEPIIQPIRGGTDGARLSFMGLPCPNLGTGSHNCHGKYEYASVSSMKKNVELLLRLAQKYGE